MDLGRIQLFPYCRAPPRFRSRIQPLVTIPTSEAQRTALKAAQVRQACRRVRRYSATLADTRPRRRRPSWRPARRWLASPPRRKRANSEIPRRQFVMMIAAWRHTQPSSTRIILMDRCVRSHRSGRRRTIAPPTVQSAILRLSPAPPSPARAPRRRHTPGPHACSCPHGAA